MLNSVVFFVLARSRFGLDAAYIQELDRISPIWKEFTLEFFASVRFSFRRDDAYIQGLDKISPIWKKFVCNIQRMIGIVEHCAAPTIFVNLFIVFMSTIIVILLLREFALNAVVILPSFGFYSLWKKTIDYLYHSAWAHLFEARIFLPSMQSGLALMCFALLAFTIAVTVAYILDPDNIPQSWKSPTLDTEMVRIQKILYVASYSNKSQFL